MIENELIKKIMIVTLLIMIICSIIYGTKNKEFLKNIPKIPNMPNMPNIPKINLNFEKCETFKKIPIKITREEFDNITILGDHTLFYFPAQKNLIETCIKNNSYIEHDNKYIIPLEETILLLPNNKWKWSDIPNIDYWEKIN